MTFTEKGKYSTLIEAWKKETRKDEKAKKEFKWKDDLFYMVLSVDSHIIQ